MKAISYYDEPINKVMPAVRKDNTYAKSNMQVKISSTINKLYSPVVMTFWRPLFDYYDERIPSHLMKSHAFPTMGGNRLASWNFEHIEGPCGTIEFRRSPGCDTVRKAKHWTAFTLGFVYQASKAGVN